MDEIEIEAYDPRWVGRFDEEAARVRKTLDAAGLVVTAVEHFGSTAVPGLAAKPVIDMLVGVGSLEQAVRVAVPALAALGYAYWYDNPNQAQMFFVKGLPPNGPRTHHIHMVEPDSVFWERLRFRDYLRAHPQEAEHYARLKRDLAERFRTDREAYTDAKAAYIRDIMQRAVQAAAREAP